MDYDTWSHSEAVPLANGIIARRTGLHYMKSPEEVCAYYRQQFGTYWFDELPKTDNTYSPSSKFYGCTLAPGIPLIPNLCRRPLRSPGSGAYDYSFESYTSLTEDSAINHHNSWREKNNFINDKKHDNGFSNHIGLTKVPEKSTDFRSAGLDSDSDYEDGYYSHTSQNTVTWFRWIITTVTTVVNIITETVTGRQHHQNHINTRVPLKHNSGVSWYQYPVLWLYQLALLVQRADIWLLSKVHSVLRVDSWGTPEKRRKWTLILLLIPLLIWAGFLLVGWLWGEDSTSEGVTISALYLPILSALTSAWDSLGSVVSSAWDWFDGSWLWAPWLAAVEWWNQPGTQGTVDSGTAEEVVGETWSDILYWPVASGVSLAISVGELLVAAAGSLGEGSVTVVTSVGTALSALLAWLLSCIATVPAFLTSALAMAAYPFKSMTWESVPVQYEYVAMQAPAAAVQPPAVHHPAPTTAPADSPSLDRLLSDKQLLGLLVRSLLNSKEFDQAMAERQTTSQQQVQSAVDSVFTAAVSKIDREFSKVKEELNDKIMSEETSVESKMDALKQQIYDLQMALKAHKAMVAEQATLGSRLEAKISTTGYLQTEEQMKLKEQILLEISRVRDEIREEFLSAQLNQKVVVAPGDNAPVPYNLEVLVNSTVERLLAIYDADKIAKVDYALATSGGSVLNTRCTETYTKKNAQYYMWGYPLWSKSANDPRIALEPPTNPGECWAFTGSRGYLVIELSENITVTAFTMEHLPRSLSPTGNIDTAPKDFKVLGLESEQDDTPILLGRFRYEDNGVSLQHFQALEVDHGFKIVELVIESNHGNLEYTCLYRFRVHGRPVRFS